MSLIFNGIPKIQRKIAWLLLFSVFSLCFVIRLLYINQHNLERTDFWTNHTNDVLKQIEQINALTIEAESSITAAPSLNIKINDQLGHLLQLTRDNPRQQQNIKDLTDHVYQKKILEDSMAIIPLSMSTDKDRLSFSWRQHRLNGLLNASLRSMMQEETALLSRRQHSSEEEYRKSMYELIAGIIFAFFFVVLILFQLNKDIALRKNAEEKFMTNEFKYRNLVENAGAVIYSTDLMGHINSASTKATELTGYPLNELESMHFSLLIAPSCIDRVNAHYYNQLKLGIRETVLTFFIVTKDKKEKWVEQSAVLLMQKNHPTGFHCIIKDISEKKQMQLELEQYEFKLKENQLLLQSILDNTTSMIYVKDLAGRYIMANRHFKEVLNLGDEDIINKTDYDISDKEVADHYKSLDDEVIRTGKSLETEELVHTENGNINLLLVKFPLLDSDHAVLGICGIATDITERVHDQQELVRAMKDAEEARGLQEQFLANMSHEIRTPMNGIQGMTNLLLDTTLTEQQKEFAVIIKRSVSNLLVIINDILDFSKIKAGKLTIEKIDFSLKDVVGNACAIFEHRLNKKGLGMQVEIDPKVPDLLKGDPHRLNQVLINLVGNAQKFTEHGYIRLEIKPENMSKGKVVLAFAVSDTGIGIPEESQPFIFENFSQAGQDISRKYGGTGLGLSICRQLLRLQGGDISVTSKPGEGSTFSFDIPYEYEEREGKSRPAHTNAYDYDHLLKGRRVLIAEDNEINQKLIDHVLKKVGAVVDIVANGEEAVKRLQDSRYDLIVMDLQMPVMDGYAATKYIRTVLKIQTPIIAMTANALKGERLRCLGVGMNDYMSKPFEFMELYRRISALLNDTGGHVAQPAGMNKTGSKAYDLGLLEEIGDREYFVDMLNAFLVQLPEELKELQVAAGQQDFDRVYFMAHKLKGSTGMLQASTLMELLTKIEQAAKEKAALSGLVEKVSLLFAELEEHLREDIRNVEAGLWPAL
ncbi:MAG TPA: PAS domain S-box protein [Puia sp.]|nr:PAS domain S-box protein [Puia sp.]